MASEKYYLTYDEIEEATRKLAKKISKRGFNPEKTLVVGIARGGLMLAQYLAYAFDIRNVVAIESERYQGEEAQDIIEIRNVYMIDYDEYDTIIVCDDIYDEGITMDTVVTILYETALAFKEKDIEIIPAVLVTQQKKKKMNQKFIEFGQKIKKINNKKPWIVFPWDTFMTREIVE